MLLVLPAIPGRHAFASEEAATLTAADGASEDYFGGSVAVSGDTALVGAPEDDVAHWDQGSTAVFRWNGSAWIEEAKLLASDAEDLDDFGTSVALVGDVALVGASLGKVVDYHGTNAAYVFRRNGSIWVEETKLIPSYNSEYGFFGYAVALSSDWAVVGAFGDGFVFVFRSDTSGWSEWARLTPSDRTGSYFGYSVAVSGNVVLVGLPVDNIGSNADQGSAYVFRWNGSTWLEEAKLVASNGAANDVFGISVAIDGDVALVGAQRREVGGRTDQGAAYVFRWNGASWVEDAMLTASDGKAGDRFGHSVALSGDTALVGTYLDDVGGNTYQGSAYVFRRRASGWREVEKLTASDGGPYDLLGDSVALGEGLALVGAPQHQVVVPGPGPGYGEGAAYVFQLPAASQVPGLPASGMALLAALLASIGALVAKRARDARMRRASPERGRG